MKKMIMFLAEGFEEVEAVTPADFLRRSNVEVVLAGVSGRKVTGAHGISIECDIEVSQIRGSYDGIIIPGGMPGAANIAKDPKSMQIITTAMNSSILIGAICAAPALVLGANGLLKGRSFTCYPGFENQVTEGRFQNKRVVCDGNLITSMGPGTAAEFSETLIEYLCGQRQVREIHEATIQK